MQGGQSLLQRADQLDGAVEGVRGAPDIARGDGLAIDRDAERSLSEMGIDGALRPCPVANDDAVPAISPRQHGARAVAAGLLLDHAVDDEITSELETDFLHRRQREQDRTVFGFAVLFSAPK